MTAVNYGELHLGQLNTISEEDYQLMVSWNPREPFACMKDSCMHHLVETKARETPAAEAVRAWDGFLTYSQLDIIATAAAQPLAQLGVHPGVYVPFAYEKSMWAVVAALAILKAGGAFVPLNPKDPLTRLADILGNVNANVVITTEGFVQIFEKIVTHVVVLSADTMVIYKHGEDGRHRDKSDRMSFDGMIYSKGAKYSHCGSTQRSGQGLKDSQINSFNGVKILHDDVVRPTDPIFVLFTSGSTGQPKGMIHEHRAICTHALTHGELMNYHGARVLQFAAHTFDVAIIDIFTTLLFGGCICIPSEEERRSNIVGVINDMNVNYAILTPSFAGLIEPSEVPTLKTLAIGGEALPQDRVQKWAEKVSLFQIYGPAEVGICLVMEMRLDTAPETVGYPLCNSSCWLVDPDNHEVLVPLGAVGELMVAGPSLARGYLNNEEKTRLSFVESPVWATRLGIKCDQFYLTGDLLRYNSEFFDGRYDIVGRKDSQIKLRGQRIEPGEIEYHIGKLPEVVVSMVNRPKQGYFTGHLVCVVQMRSTDSQRSRVRDEPIRLGKSQSLTIETIRRSLSKALPSFMIPSVSLCIDSMPFVPSLKIDRRRVEGWLAAMESRPAEIDPITLGRLLPGEATAIALSLKVAELISRKDISKLLVLEGHDFGLQQAGIDSIQIISLSIYLQRDHMLKIPMDVLLGSEMTIRELARFVDGQASSSVNGHELSSHLPQTVNIANLFRKSANDLFRKIELRPYTNKLKMEPQASIQKIFLTGATGYLGSAILRQLLVNPRIHVFALVRCSSKEAGLQHIIAAATAYNWWQDSYIPRLHVWQGDLTKPNFNLGKPELEALHGIGVSESLAIHAIIHNGARVHYSSSYSTLAITNIHPTLQLLQVTAQSPHISTFGFVSGGLKPNLEISVSSPTDMALLNEAGGYAQTKFVSEQVVRDCSSHAAFQAKNLRIVKPGYIMGSRHAGIANTSDFIWRLIAGCVEIGAYNLDEAGHWVFIADVEEVSRRVVAGIVEATGKPSGQVERVLEGLRFSELWNLLEKGFGYRLKALAREEWMGRLRGKVMERQDEHLLYPLLHVLERDGYSIGERIFENAEGGTFHVIEAVERNVRYLIEAGFLPKPREHCF